MINNILAVLTLGMIRPKLGLTGYLFIAAIGVAAFYNSPLHAQQRMDFNCEDHLHDDLAAMACNIYWEGRNQGSKGMMAVAAVTLWRVKDSDWPDTVADVVWQKNWSKKFGRMIPMFTWTLDGKRDHPFKNEQAQWDEAWIIARNFAMNSEQKDRMCPHIRKTLDKWNAMEEKGEIVTREPIVCEAYDEFLKSKYYMMSILDPTDGATLYHANYVKPWWMDSYVFSKKVGVHLFYLNERVVTPQKSPETEE